MVRENLIWSFEVKKDGTCILGHMKIAPITTNMRVEITIGLGGS